MTASQLLNNGWNYPGPATDMDPVNLATDTDYATAAQCPRAVRVSGTAGDVKVKTLAGVTKTIPAVQVGETVPVCVSYIFSTANGTTAVGVTVLY